MQWSAVIARMMSYGAVLTPADQRKLTEYLNGLAEKPSRATEPKNLRFEMA